MNLYLFTEIVLASLEAKAENMSSCLDNLDEDEYAFDDLDIPSSKITKSRSIFGFASKSSKSKTTDDLLDLKPKKPNRDIRRSMTISGTNLERY